jgi:hypothetical protein
VSFPDATGNGTWQGASLHKVAARLCRAPLVYERAGLGSRVLEFLPDGFIGTGTGGCERWWDLRLVKAAPGGTRVVQLEVFGEQGLTFRARPVPGGGWSGAWVDFEKCAVTLHPVRKSRKHGQKEPVPAPAVKKRGVPIRKPGSQERKKRPECKPAFHGFMASKFKMGHRLKKRKNDGKMAFGDEKKRSESGSEAFRDENKRSRSGSEAFRDEKKRSRSGSETLRDVGKHPKLGSEAFRDERKRSQSGSEAFRDEKKRSQSGPKAVQDVAKRVRNDREPVRDTPGRRRKVRKHCLAPNAY